MAGTVKSWTENTPRKALLLGMGYCARALLKPLQDVGFKVIGTSQTQDKADTLGQQLDIHMMEFAGRLTPELLTTLSTADIILSSIPPTDKGDPVINALTDKALLSNATWVGYLSATSVYGDRNGQWAFEDELLFPTTQRGRNRVEAELQWLETGARVHIFRLAGIYGPDVHGIARNPFSRIKNGQARAVIKPGHVVNRIHVQDIADAVMASLKVPNPASVYNIADGNPAPPQDVINFAVNLIDAPAPKQISHDDATLSDMARSFYSESKRVATQRAKTELGWTPKYPHYKSGLTSIFKTMRSSL